MIREVDIRYITSSKGAKPMTDTKADYKFTPPAPSKVVVMTPEAKELLLAEARAEEREQCCKDICSTCRFGILKVIKWRINGSYVHVDKDNHVVCSCNANAIRERAAKEHSPS
jgi:hypothetical protein